MSSFAMKYYPKSSPTLNRLLPIFAQELSKYGAHKGDFERNMFAESYARSLDHGKRGADGGGRREVGGCQPRAGIAPARGHVERRGAGGAAVCILRGLP